MSEEFFIIAIIVSILFIAIGFHYNKYFRVRFGYDLWIGTIAMALSIVLFYLALEKGREYEYYLLFLNLSSVIVFAMLMFNFWSSHSITHGLLSTFI